MAVLQASLRQRKVAGVVRKTGEGKQYSTYAKLLQFSVGWRQFHASVWCVEFDEKQSSGAMRPGAKCQERDGACDIFLGLFRRSLRGNTGCGRGPRSCAHFFFSQTSAGSSGRRVLRGMRRDSTSAMADEIVSKARFRRALPQLAGILDDGALDLDEMADGFAGRPAAFAGSSFPLVRRNSVRHGQELLLGASQVRGDGLERGHKSQCYKAQVECRAEARRYTRTPNLKRRRPRPVRKREPVAGRGLRQRLGRRFASRRVISRRSCHRAQKSPERLPGIP